MSINYEKVGWNPSIYFGPTNMNHMDDGIKAACDGVDELKDKAGATDISKIGDGTVTGAVAQNAKDIAAVNSNLSVMGGITVRTVTLSVDAEAGKETEYVLIDNIPDGTYIISTLTHVDNAPIPDNKRLFMAINSRGYVGASLIAGNSKTWQWAQTMFFKGTNSVIRILPEFNFSAQFNMSIFLMRIK